MLRLRLPSLQIIGRELIEVASRRRTYVIRCIAALGILVVFRVNDAQLENAAHGYDLIGKGMALVTPVFLCICIGMVILLPPMAAMSVTREREQGTLVLLALTPVRPASLLLQKYLIQLFLAGSLAVLALPILAIGYSLGGMDPRVLGAIALLLAMMAVQIPAIGLASGCVLRGTTAAVLGSYALVAFQIVPFFLLNSRSHNDVPWWLYTSPFMPIIGSNPQGQRLDFGLAFFPLAFSAVLLLVAWLTILRRLEPSAATLLGRTLRGLDAFFVRIDARWLKRGATRDLPVRHPVLWRESSRSSFCNWRYLLRMLLPLLVALIVLEFYFLRDGDVRPARLMLLVTFIAGALLISMLGAGMANRERADQTLDVLLATGVTAASILDQKARALARLRWAATGGLMLILSGVWWVQRDMAGVWYSYSLGMRMEPLSGMNVVTIGVETILAYCTCFWMAVRIGLQARSSARGVMLTLLAVGLWFVVFPFLYELKDFVAQYGLLSQDDEWRVMLGACSGYHLCATLAGDSPPAELPALMAGWGVNLGFCVLLRWICMHFARRWVSLPSG